MKGTEKQIKWAQDIIDGAYTALDLMDKNFDRLESEHSGLGLITCQYDHKDVQAVREWLKGQLDSIDSAADIISVRSKLSMNTLENLAQNHHKFGC